MKLVSSILIVSLTLVLTLCSSITNAKTISPLWQKIRPKRLDFTKYHKAWNTIQQQTMDITLKKLPILLKVFKLNSAPITVSRKKKIMILMSDTGGGHRASANALSDAFEELYPGEIQCDIVDIWTDYGAWPCNKVVPIYKTAAKNPMLWRCMWWYGVFAPTRALQESLVLKSNYGRVKHCIEKYSPDLIVSAHPLCQGVPMEAVKAIETETAKKIPFVTVVTDLGTAHPTWFHDQVDLCFVASDSVRLTAEREGLKPHQIRQYSLVLRKGFWKRETRSKQQMRELLGLNPHQKVVLVVGGGDGVGSIVKISSEIAKSLLKPTSEIIPQIKSINSSFEKSKEKESKPSENFSQSPQFQPEKNISMKDDSHFFQLVVVCGSNDKAKRKLEKLKEKKWLKGINVKVLNYVDNMQEYMCASECIVTKAGPGTIAEAMCCGCPTLLSCYLPGQEAGNVPFVISNNFGDHQSNAVAIGQTVKEWMHNPNKLKEMSAAALASSRPSATLDIAKDIADLLWATESALGGSAEEI